MAALDRRTPFSSAAVDWIWVEAPLSLSFSLTIISNANGRRGSMLMTMEKTGHPAVRYIIMQPMHFFTCPASYIAATVPSLYV